MILNAQKSQGTFMFIHWLSVQAIYWSTLSSFFSLSKIGKIYQLLILCRPGGKATEMDKLQILHHVLGWQSMYCALIFLNLPIVFASAGLWMEVSTIFIAFRWLMFIHGIMGGDWKQGLNTVFAAFSFLFLRTIFLLFILLAVGVPYMYSTFFLE